jgi:hypothetical protein
MHTPEAQETVLTSPTLVTVTVAFVNGVPPIVPLAVPLKVKTPIEPAKATAVDTKTQIIQRMDSPEVAGHDFL